jgi:hypothetical protein
MSVMAGEEVTAPKRRWWHLGTMTSTIVFALLLSLEGWALSSTDADFYLPDFFRPLAIGLLALFLATALIPWRWLRSGLRTLAIVTLGAILVQEFLTRREEINLKDQRIEQTSDVLLRYHYRPGAEIHDRWNNISHVNRLGLWDEEHAIPKPPDVFRIAILTGSIANDGGVPYHERFVRQLEKELQGAIPGKRIETINVSCDGYNVVQQVRLLEQVGLQYQPDLVVDAYMLTSAAIQNGGYRRIGNSFFVFRFLPLISRAQNGSLCSMFAPFHERYTFDLIVRNSFERLALLKKLHGFDAFVAVLPILERFDDPLCLSIYDKVVKTAQEAGLPAIRVVDAFKGESFTKFAKPDAPGDVCHPNAAGHSRIASALAAEIRQHLRAKVSAP